MPANFIKHQWITILLFIVLCAVIVVAIVAVRLRVYTISGSLDDAQRFNQEIAQLHSDIPELPLDSTDVSYFIQPYNGRIFIEFDCTKLLFKDWARMLDCDLIEIDENFFDWITPAGDFEQIQLGPNFIMHRKDNYVSVLFDTQTQHAYFSKYVPD